MFVEYCEVLKQIRKILSISQEQLARDLNVSYTTLNRWENNRTSPSRLAKMRVVDYCVAKGLTQEVIDMIKPYY
jgi:transcriptional regulator with XRE-family HTH domain